jgi:hypothetical protein
VKKSHQILRNSQRISTNFRTGKTFFDKLRSNFDFRLFSRARTQILKQQDARDREKHVMKYIKIMKHLRKINNFNSYLALLSALDSAPIRRLEWQKNITEGLKEYCALIDSSSSFRAYRQALSETK